MQRLASCSVTRCFITSGTPATRYDIRSLLPALKSGKGVSHPSNVWRRSTASRRATCNDQRQHEDHATVVGSAPVYRHTRPSRKLQRPYSTGLETATNAKPFWTHDAVFAPGEGYNGLSLDTYTSSFVKSSETDLQGESSPSSQILQTLQLQNGPNSDAEPTRTHAKKHDIILYLPRGPFPGHSTSDEEEFQQFLNAFASAHQSKHEALLSGLTVIKVNYRLKPADGENQETAHRYPLPVFDINWALDHVKEQYEGPLQEGARLLVYGRNFGGSLALTMALTNYDDIHALAVIDPLTDWLGLDEVAEHDVNSDGASNRQLSSKEVSSLADDASVTPQRGRNSEKEMLKAAYRHEQARAAKQLINLRTNLFHTPSGFFDRFASPLLFLRAPGRDTPLWSTARPEGDSLIEATAYGPYDDDWPSKRTDISEKDSSSEPTEHIARLNTIAEAIGVDTISSSSEGPPLNEDSAASSDELQRSDAPTSQSAGRIVQSSTSATEATPKIVRRRKVLYRWPPTGVSEGALLPETRILSTVTRPVDPEIKHEQFNIDYASILHPQAKEMTDVMRRACFWGQGGDIAEARVTFEAIPHPEEGEAAGIDKAVDWLTSKLSRM